MQIACFNEWLVFHLSSSFIVKKAFKIRLNDEFSQEHYGVLFPGYWSTFLARAWQLVGNPSEGCCLQAKWLYILQTIF